MVRDVRYYWKKEEIKIKGISTVPWTREEVVNLFNSFDKDSDGMLSKEELKAAFSQLGSHWGGFRARRALSYADANRDGLISKEEIKDLVNYALKCGYKLN